MGGYSADFRVFQEVLDDMDKARSDIESQLSTLVSDINNHLDPEHWTQHAKNVFKAVQEKWNADTESMHTVLGTAHNTLTNIKFNYQLADQQGKNMFETLQM